MFGKGQKIALGLLLVGVTVVLSSAYLIYEEQQRVLPPDFVYVEESEVIDDYVSSKPVHIDIDKADISVDVDPGVVRDGRWSIVPDAANYLVSSSLPGDGGNIVLYGHNRKDVFGNLKKVGTNDVVTLFTENGDEKKYKIVKKYVTHANDEVPLQERQEEILTIYTCTGFLDTKRFVIEGHLI